MTEGHQGEGNKLVGRNCTACVLLYQLQMNYV